MIANVRRRAASDITSDMALSLPVEASSVQVRSLTLPSSLRNLDPSGSGASGEAGLEEAAGAWIAREPDLHLVHHVGARDAALVVGEAERAPGAEVTER